MNFNLPFLKHLISTNLYGERERAQMYVCACGCDCIQNEPKLFVVRCIANEMEIQWGKKEMKENLCSKWIG